MKTEECKQQKNTEEHYVAPAIEIIDIELTQNFLGSDGANGAELPEYQDGGSAW